MARAHHSQHGSHHLLHFQCTRDIWCVSRCRRDATLISLSDWTFLNVHDTSRCLLTQRPVAFIGVWASLVLLLKSILYTYTWLTCYVAIIRLVFHSLGHSKRSQQAISTNGRNYASPGARRRCHSCSESARLSIMIQL